MSGERGGQVHPHPKCSGNRFDKTRLSGCSRRHLPYVGVHRDARKILCQHAVLPERPERPHFAVAAGTAGHH
jgi:hypothetical protein